MSPEPLHAYEGEIYEQFATLRRRRALFQLSLEGENSLMMTSAPDKFVVAASYDDDGYTGEPLRVKVITMTSAGKMSNHIPFEGSTPNDLIDLMIDTCKSMEQHLSLQDA